MLKIKATLSRILDTDINEEYEEILFHKGNEIYRGALFFTLEKCDKLQKNIVTETIKADTHKELVEKCIEFYLKNHTGKVFDSTSRSMKYWQYINGFTKYMFPI